MLGFYVLLEDPDANVIIAQCTAAVGFFKVMTYNTLYCWSAQPCVQ